MADESGCHTDSDGVSGVRCHTCGRVKPVSDFVSKRKSAKPTVCCEQPPAGVVPCVTTQLQLQGTAEYYIYVVIR